MAQLRAVGPGHVPAEEQPAKRLTVAQAAKSGDQKSLLITMRDRIAETVSKPDCPPRDLSSLTKRLQDIARDIAALEALENEAKQSTNATADDSRFDASAV